MKTKIIYLIGKPGVGKYTISKELAKFGYIICDNQLINNPIFALLNYDGFGTIPEFAWDSVKKIRDTVFEFIASEKERNYILTNCLFEDEGDKNLYEQVESMAIKRDAIFVPVKLSVSKEEHLMRITQPSRRERWKSIDANYVDSKVPLLTVKHPNLLELDVTNLSAMNAADKIFQYVEGLK
jgi:broad-specificity NMP kinase